MSGFNKETREKLYNEVKGIVTTYFVNTDVNNVEEYNVEISEDDDFFNTLQLNYNIIKMLELGELLKYINNKLRRDIRVENVDITNSIRGRLDVPKYIKREYFKIQTKKSFPCKVLKEDYNTIENEFLLMIIHYAFKLIKDIPIDDSDFAREFNASIYCNKLKKLRKDLFHLLHNGEFKLLSQNDYSINQRQIAYKINKILPIVSKKIKRKEINPKTYGKIVDWWISIDKGINNLNEVPLLLYNVTFDDKLFEIWLIEKIKESFINNFSMKIDKYSDELATNPLWKRTKTHIYRFNYKDNNEEKVIKIYFQKSKDLIWNNESKPKWSMYNLEGYPTKGHLRGNLDIIITCDDCKEFDPVLIDAKNMYYINIDGKGKERVDPVVSDKVYKMVGYLDNFYKTAKRHGNCSGILVLKNTRSTIKKEREYVSDTNDGKISIFSVDVTYENLDFFILSNNILNSFR
jgi:hypothetical protein